MTRKQHIAHGFVTALLIAASGAAELLTSGSWSHFAWAAPAAALLAWVVRHYGGGAGPAATAVLLATSLALGGCAHTPPIVTGVIHCAEQATHEAALSLLDDVTTARPIPSRGATDWRRSSRNST